MNNFFQLDCVLNGARASVASVVLGTTLLGMVSFTPALQADQITTAPGFGPWQQGGGGEFTVTPDAAIAALLGNYSPFTSNQGGFRGSFQTFCLERNEYILPNTTFDVTLNTVTVFSGVPLTAGVAYLYEQFATGNLNYNYADIPVGGRTEVGFANALMLQNAIWYFMGDYSGQANNPYVLLADGALGGAAASFAPDNGARGVKVLNLWTPGQPHDPQHTFQDVLILVPEPSALALISLAGLIAIRRRK